VSGPHNGSMKEAFDRIGAAEDDQRDLRQLFMSEMRRLWEEMKHIKEISQHNARALDLLLEIARHEEEAESDG